jgi:hypothetical protein
MVDLGTDQLQERASSGAGWFLNAAWAAGAWSFLVLACAGPPAPLPSRTGAGHVVPDLQPSQKATATACEPLTFTPLSYDEQVALLEGRYAPSLKYGDRELVPGDLVARDDSIVAFDHKAKSARAVRSPSASWVFDGLEEEQTPWFLICEGTLQAHDPSTLRVLWRLGIGEHTRVDQRSVAPGLLAVKFSTDGSPCWFTVVRPDDGSVVWRSEAFQSADVCSSAHLTLGGNAGFLSYREESFPQGPVSRRREILVNVLTGERWFDETASVARYEASFRSMTGDLLLREQPPPDGAPGLALGARVLTAHSLSTGRQQWSRPVCSGATECELQIDAFEGRPVVLHGDPLAAELVVLDSATGTPVWARSTPLTDLAAVQKAGRRWVFGAARSCVGYDCPPPNAYRVLDMTTGALLHETSIEKVGDFAVTSGSSALEGERLAVFLPHAGTLSREERVALYPLGKKRPIWTTPSVACLLGSEHQVLLDERTLHVCGCDNVLRSYDLETRRLLLRVGVEHCGLLTLENGALAYAGAPLMALPWVNAPRRVQIHGQTCVDGAPDEYSGVLQVGDRRIRAPLGPFTVQSTLPGYITVQAVPTHTDLEWDSPVVGPLETEADVGSACVGHFHP